MLTIESNPQLKIFISLSWRIYITLYFDHITRHLIIIYIIELNLIIIRDFFLWEIEKCNANINRWLKTSKNLYIPTLSELSLIYSYFILLQLFYNRNIYNCGQFVVRRSGHGTSDVFGDGTRRGLLLRALRGRTVRAERDGLRRSRRLAGRRLDGPEARVREKWETGSGRFRMSGLQSNWLVGRSTAGGGGDVFPDPVLSGGVLPGGTDGGGHVNRATDDDSPRTHTKHIVHERVCARWTTKKKTTL